MSPDAGKISDTEVQLTEFPDIAANNRSNASYTRYPQPPWSFPLHCNEHANEETRSSNNIIPQLELQQYPSPELITFSNKIKQTPYQRNLDNPTIQTEGPNYRTNPLQASLLTA